MGSGASNTIGFLESGSINGGRGFKGEQQRLKAGRVRQRRNGWSTTGGGGLVTGGIEEIKG